MSMIVKIIQGALIGCACFLLLQEAGKAQHPDPDASVFAIVNPRIYDMKGFVHRRLSTATEKDKKEAARLAAEGEILHRKNHDPIRGLRAYEKAVMLYPDPSYYYEIGNCLSNGKKYADAVTAYRASVERGYGKKHLAWYNAACAASLMNDTGQALRFLEMALANGYDSLVYIRKDPDMASLHGKTPFYRLLAVYESRRSPLERRLVGVWQNSPMMVSGWGDTYQFFHDGTFVFNVNQMDCGKRLRAEYGTWHCEGTTLHLSINKQMVIEGGKQVPASGSCASKYEIEGGKTIVRNIMTVSKTMRVSAPVFDDQFEKPGAVLGSKKFWRFSIIAEDYK